MLKKIVLLIVLLISIQCFSQTLYSERFNSLTVKTATYVVNNTTQTYLYEDTLTSMYTINNGNLIADTLTGNYPFRVTGLKKSGWLGYKPYNLADTFAVSTSWLSPAGVADVWLITPTINNITANTVLTWEALAPDVSNADGYEVYVTTNTSTTAVVGDFTGSNIIYSASAENSSWTNRGVSLAAYAGQSIRIAFKNNSNDKYQLWIDDIIVKNISSSFDMEAISNNTYKYSTVNTNNSITASFKNNGSTAVTSVLLNYQFGNGAVVTESQLLATPLSYLEVRQFTFSTLYISSTASYSDLKIWISAINSQADQVHANDTVKGSLTLSTAVPAKKILVEEFTSAKCNSCPDGYTQLSSIVSTNTNVIAASVHSNDNLTSVSGTTLTNNYSGGLPSAMIDRYIYPAAGRIATSKNDWNTYIAQRQDMKVPVSVSVTAVNYNTATRQITATVDATFVGDVKGDYRINLYVKENNIYGPINDHSDNGWNQYSNLYNIPSSPYYQIGSYLNADTYLMAPTDFTHKYVVNEFLDGAYGAAGIIPANGNTNGQTFSKTYAYTLPLVFGGQFRYNYDNVYLIGVVSEYNVNELNGIAVLNAAEAKLTTNPEWTVGVKEIAQQEVEMKLYPNPSSTHCFLSYVSAVNQLVKINVYNTLGELVYTKLENVSAGEVTQHVDCSQFAEGNYQIVVSFKEYSVSKKLTIIK